MNIRYLVPKIFLQSYTCPTHTKQDVVDEETCSRLTLIEAYKFLLFGYKVAPSVFQKIVDMLAELNFTMTYSDEILIKHVTLEQQKLHVKEVLKNSECGFKLSRNKYKFYMSKIKYFGQIINAKFWRLHPERSCAIRNMSAPTNFTELQGFWSSANYHQVYINKCMICVPY